MGLSPSELYAMELGEFSSAYEGWAHLRQMTMREDMERSRWEAAVIISPHLTARKPLTELLPLPWDKNSITTSGEDIDIEERRRRAEQMLKDLNHEHE